MSLYLLVTLLDLRLPRLSTTKLHQDSSEEAKIMGDNNMKYISSQKDHSNFPISHNYKTEGTFSPRLVETWLAHASRLLDAFRHHSDSSVCAQAEAQSSP
jgi:hypothetical protein